MSSPYEELKNWQQAEINAFPIHYAFGDKQINDKVKELGFANEAELRNNVIALGYTGGFILKTDKAEFEKMIERHRQEFEDAIDDKETGEQFCTDMFLSLLYDTEYTYTGELEDALNSLYLTKQEIEANPNLKKGLDNALAIIEEREAIAEAIENRWRDEQEYDRTHGDEPDICDD